jgi:hypothetical protein
MPLSAGPAIATSCGRKGFSHATGRNSAGKGQEYSAAHGTIRCRVTELKGLRRFETRGPSRLVLQEEYRSVVTETGETA